MKKVRASRKQRKNRIARKGRRALKSQRNKLIAPRTPKQYFAMPRQFQELWDNVVQVPAKMRSGLTLPEASRELGLDPHLVRRLAAPAFRKLRNGRLVAKPTDRLLRMLVVLSKKEGLIESFPRDSYQASLVGAHWSAVERFLSRGDYSRVTRFKRIRIIMSDGKRIQLMTDADELIKLGSAGKFGFESIYGGRA
jgi:hypothetical protein